MMQSLTTLNNQNACKPATRKRAYKRLAAKRLYGQAPVVGERYDTWFKNRDGSDCKLIRVDPYTGIYKQDFNCVLVFECDKLNRPAEMAYQNNNYPVRHL